MLVNGRKTRSPSLEVPACLGLASMSKYAFMKLRVVYTRIQRNVGFLTGLKPPDFGVTVVYSQSEHRTKNDGKRNLQTAMP